MYAGEFDGAAAFAGGGFMPSEPNQAPEPSFTPARNRNVRTLLPMTVKQISDISRNDESGASFDGLDVSTVTILGMVCDIQDKEPQFIFLVDDGTGQIECSRWAHERMEFDEVNQISQGMYVRVSGHLRSLQNKRSLNAYSIRPVSDFDEITFHFIECIYAQIYNSKLQGSILSDKLQGSCSTQSQMKNSVNSKAIPSNQYSFDGLKSIDQTVLNFLRQPECLAFDNGVHRNHIAQQLNVPMDKLMEVLECLTENSLVYSVDDDHFKSAVNA